MNKQEVKNTIEKLRDSLHRHNYLYYQKAQAEISDYEYDMMLKELEQLEAKHPEFQSPHSPTQRVGSDINKSFEQAAHERPMLSLGNTYNKEELTDFDKRIKRLLPPDTKFKYVCELKYDGAAISLIYENGKLIRAVTRGDGTKGDIVTDNVKTIKRIPLDIAAISKDFPEQFEMRGEILMPRSVFVQLNQEREEQGETAFANPRNAAAGTLKMQNSAQAAKRKLDAFFYFMLSDNLPSDSHYENLQYAKKMGFKVPENSVLADNISDVFDYINYWDEKRKALDYDTDGVVIKVDSLQLHDELGATGKSPRWAISYKFKAESAESVLEAVEFQVGRTGAITPVAHLSPVLLAGTTVKRASLHNEDIIKELDLHYGDTVHVEKGGEIIPKITAVDTEKRSAGAKSVEFPDKCPACGSQTERIEGEAAHYCPNSLQCPAQIKGKIEHFVSRKAMDINCGEATIKALYEKGLIKNAADLYLLKPEQIIQLEGFKEKSSQKLYNSIQESKNTPFERVLFALGIRHVGENAAKLLAKEFQTLENLQNANLEALTGVNEIGEKIAESIINFFNNPDNMAIINRLKDAGLQFEQTALENQSNKLEGLTIVLSGSFERHSRDELKQLIELHGGKNSGSVSKNTDYFLAGENTGPKKIEKVEQLGIKKITESDFEEMIGS
jgi:DNA ligase (NAD+)